MGLGWALNESDFEDFGVHVSSSKGILDKLKPRERNSYSWAEYHGKQVDLSKPKYEAREIELTCWIKAANIDDITDKFNTFLSVFDRSSTVRFSLRPFDQKPYAFEVFLNNQVELTKEFREGEMYGSFTLNLIEPNPIKKVLKTSLDSFRLKYLSSSETEIFPGDGTKLIGRGNVDFQFDYSEPSFQSSGISLVQGSVINDEYFEMYIIPASQNTYQFSVNISLLSPKNVILYVIGRKQDDAYNVLKTSSVIQGVIGVNLIKLTFEIDLNAYTKFFLKVLDTAGQEIPGISYSNPKIETAEVVGNWQNMLGKEKTIIIAGDIDEIKNLETPAEEIWTKI